MMFAMTATSVIEQLAAVRTIDITTIGRQSGREARIEIWWFRVDDRFIITGTPGRRDWFANVLADPRIVVHAPFGDFAGTAARISDPELRRRVITDPDLSWYRSRAELEALIDEAPMIELTLDLDPHED